MRKGIMIGIMALIVGAYIFMLQREPASTQKDKEVVKDMITTQSLLEDMPQTPEELIAKHNDIMKKLYSSQMTEEIVPQIIEALRLLYSNEFLQLNLQQEQEQVVKGELVINQANGLYLLDSKLEYIKYKDTENEAEAIVLHQTTKGDQKRIYHLILEEGNWKIKSWENIKSSAATKILEEK